MFNFIDKVLQDKFLLSFRFILTSKFKIDYENKLIF